MASRRRPLPLRFPAQGPPPDAPATVTRHASGRVLTVECADPFAAPADPTLDVLLKNQAGEWCSVLLAPIPGLPESWQLILASSWRPPSVAPAPFTRDDVGVARWYLLTEIAGMRNAGWYIAREVGLGRPV